MKAKRLYRIVIEERDPDNKNYFRRIQGAEILEEPEHMLAAVVKSFESLVQQPAEKVSRD